MAEQSISKGGEVVLTTKVDRLVEFTDTPLVDPVELAALQTKPISARILVDAVDRLIEVTGDAVKDAAELKGLTEARPASKTEPAA